MKRITARFFQTDAGNEPVKVWLQSLARIDCKIVGTDIAKVEFGWPLGMPVCRPVRGGLREVRSTIKAGTVEARTYFGIDGSEMILLNGHEGKTGQKHEIDVAIDRWKDYQARKRLLAAGQRKETGK